MYTLNQERGAWAHSGGDDVDAAGKGKRDAVGWYVMMKGTLMTGLQLRGCLAVVNLSVWVDREGLDWWGMSVCKLVPGLRKWKGAVAYDSWKDEFSNGNKDAAEWIRWSRR